MKKTYTAAQIKAQAKKDKAAENRYIKAVGKPPTQANKKRAVELFNKSCDEFTKLQEMKANRKRK